MTLTLKTGIWAFSLTLAAIAHSPRMMAQASIIPVPQQVEYGTGVFTLSADTRCRAKGKGAAAVASLFREKVREATGWKLREGEAKKGGSDITFELTKTVQGEEAYTLTATPTHVTIQAATTAGLYYGYQSLLQLLPAEIEEKEKGTPPTTWTLPVVTIHDAPRFAYRGVMLDPCRHFLSVSAIKKQIEHLAAFKINRLHWHLTDDQGWRIEIKKYPRLTTVGSERTEGDSSRYKGYYTQDEVRDIVAFAAQHHIDIVPEFEMPGHEMAAIAAYPELSCRGEATSPRIIWGVENVVLCPGKESTFTFLKEVIDEMLPLFPGKYFHIGGDESPREEWQACSNCQARMRSEGLTREAQLQSYLIARIGKYLHERGRRLIGWDEILEGSGLDTTAIVMSWRGEQGGITAAGMGHSVIMTPSSHGFYFDQYQSDPALEPTAIGGYTTLEKVYRYDPIPEVLAQQGAEKYVLGVQANCWSEYMLSAATLEYRLWPRALALAEVAWSQPERKSYDDFIRRVDNEAARRMQAWGLHFHIPQPEQPGGSTERIVFTDSASLSLTSVRPMKIVYTTDGTLPTPRSQEYTAPIPLRRTTTIRTACVLPCGIMGPVRDIYAQKEALHSAVLLSPQDTLDSGLLLSIYKGTYLSPYQLPATPTTTKRVGDLRALRTQTRVPANVRGVDNYAATAEGFLQIPEDGVYEFSTNNHQLWVDGRLLVDNAQMACPRYSPHNAPIPLKKGLHRLKVLFIGGIFAGWPTYWDDASVKMRRDGGEWTTLSAEHLKVTGRF